jgi:hypothetical protein
MNANQPGKIARILQMQKALAVTSSFLGMLDGLCVSP